MHPANIASLCCSVHHHATVARCERRCGGHDDRIVPRIVSPLGPVTSAVRPIHRPTAYNQSERMRTSAAYVPVAIPSRLLPSTTTPVMACVAVQTQRATARKQQRTRVRV